MLTREKNDLLTQTGPGTPMGDLFRCFWHPALLAEELPEPDCPPVRVQLLSERLIAFRDSEGRLGLIDEFCAHRCVSLWFGRNEESGLRCPYHGWKYDVFGNCVDVPSEANPEFRHQIRLKSYPMVEKGGVLWAYMGAPERKPPLPEYEFCTVRPERRFVSKRLQECNWLQAMEGGIDSSHVSFLHSGALNTDPLFKGSEGNKYNMADQPPRVRGGPEHRRPADRRPAKRGGQPLLLENHAVVDAGVHHDSAPGRSPRARSFLGPHRR